ncbi:unnamed protein product [Ilex paraguariensis]|uniref:DUF6821 domain-containing protein n=1 Tax=Ilex paraguariensis TaxID=185542 RepID=A0ABC8SUG9_9AQUA
MDLDEWELLPDDGFLEIHDDDGKKIFSRKYSTDTNSAFKMNYFLCPSPKSQQIVGSPGNSKLPNQVVPVPIQLEPPTIGKDPPVHELVKEISTIPFDIGDGAMPSPISGKIKAPPIIGAVEADQDPVSQVFFKKMKETEFVDMKMDSPKSSSRGIVPQMDAGTFQFEDKGEGCKGEAFENKNCSAKNKGEKEVLTKKNNLDSEIKEEVTWEEGNGGLNIWKWSLSGIGAICSFGVAAATICIIIVGSHQRKPKPQQNQKLQLQIYSNDKRIKQVVHHATKLNEAISAVRGDQLTRAHITFGGYYNGL